MQEFLKLLLTYLETRLGAVPPSQPAHLRNMVQVSCLQLDLNAGVVLYAIKRNLLLFEEKYFGGPKSVIGMVHGT